MITNAIETPSLSLESNSVPCVSSQTLTCSSNSQPISVRATGTHTWIPKHYSPCGFKDGCWVCVPNDENPLFRQIQTSVSSPPSSVTTLSLESAISNGDETTEEPDQWRDFLSLTRFQLKTLCTSQDSWKKLERDLLSTRSFSKTEWKIIDDKFAKIIKTLSFKANGREVIAFLLSNIPHPFLKTVIQKLETVTVKLSINKNGTLVIQYLIQHLSPPFRSSILKKIISSTHEVFSNQHGSVVIDLILRGCDMETIETIVRQLKTSQRPYPPLLSRVQTQLSKVLQELENIPISTVSHPIGEAVITRPSMPVSNTLTNKSVSVAKQSRSCSTDIGDLFTLFLSYIPLWMKL